VVTILTRATLCLAALSFSTQANAFGIGGWGAVFPPLTPEDVEALGEAADQVDAGRGDGADGTAGWENESTGTYGTVQAGEEFERDGRECRRYRLFIKVQGFEPYNAEPAMCKADDGKWKFVTR